MTAGQPDIEWNEIAGAFLDTHSRINTAARKTLETASFLFGLIELCAERGLISIEELDTRQRLVAERLEAQMKNGAGVKLQHPEYDKYSFAGSAEIDCDSRLDLCRAACCRLPFALSRQDIEERVIRWDLAHPYLIAHNPAGYCVHLDENTCHCTVREHRPVPCRAYDCRQEKRIWLDFEGRVINPAVYDPRWPYCDQAAPDGERDPEQQS